MSFCKSLFKEVPNLKIQIYMNYRLHHFVPYLILNLFCACPFFLSATEYLTIANEQQGWRVNIHPENGTISQYQQKIDNQWETISFRDDSLAGPSWEGVQLHPLNKPYTFGAQKENIQYTLTYRAESDHLVVECMLSNQGAESFEPEYSRLYIGIDAEMKTFPEWDTKFFPTLLRCEKDFAWGYFMSPRQVIMGVGVEEPLASYTLNYIYEGDLEWNWGHQIKTASFDFLHCLPLPDRHPQNLVSLQPGETKKWTMHIGNIRRLSEVKEKLSRWIQAPMIECEKYTITDREKSTVRIYSESDLKVLTVTDPNGKLVTLPVEKLSENVYSGLFKPSAQKGVYWIKATSMNDKTSEASIYVRNSWSWYLKNARDFVAENPPLFSNGCEAFYGYYTAFIGARYFPDATKDRVLEERFNCTLPLFIDTLTWVPKEDAAPDRVQNFSSLIGMLVDLWETTRNNSYLEKAAHIGDYLCSEKVQSADGAYRSKGIHYTAVIYPAKSMLELVTAEKNFIDQPRWRMRYERHKRSAQRAIEDLLLRLDDIQTEGDMTFEDGMITCSALQLALQGLSEEDSVMREKYTAAAAYMMDKHQCLEQLLIPDCRMRGGTLRYWEALDVYFVPNQVMNSPHGWTAWKIYASYYLYLLTGKVHYLADVMDTLGACAQIMDLNGHLRWGFIPDPYIKGQICMERTDKKHDWHPVDSIVGEQYLEMISPWLRPDDENSVCMFGERGGAGDNTVQEIFKVMEECILTSAYVVVDEAGQLQSWNCSAGYQDGILRIVPDEEMIKNIHINSSRNVELEVVVSDKWVRRSHIQGMKWISL